MAGDEEAENLFFVLQTGVLVPLGRVGSASSLAACGGRVVVEHAEEAVLARGGVALRFLRALHGLVECGEDLGAAAEGVHRAGLDQRLQHALVQQAQVDLLAELPEAGEARLAFCAQRFPCGKIDSMALWPTFLMAARPKRMASPVRA